MFLNPDWCSLYFPTAFKPVRQAQRERKGGGGISHVKQPKLFKLQQKRVFIKELITQTKNMIENKQYTFREFVESSFTHVVINLSDLYPLINACYMGKPNHSSTVVHLLIYLIGSCNDIYFMYILMSVSEHMWNTQFYQEDNLNLRFHFIFKRNKMSKTEYSEAR